MRALQFRKPQTAAVVDVEPPRPGPGEAVVAPRYVGLCGTDLELFTGTMPYFAEGHAAFPIQPGHEVAAVVVSAPAGGPEPGSRVLVDPVVGCGGCRACGTGIQVRCSERRELGVRGGLPGG